MDTSLKLIAGDASDRKFYRHLSSEGESLAVCMQFSSWDGGFGGDPLSWLDIHAALMSMSIPVPEIYKVDKNSCTIWTEDLGDNFLSSKLMKDCLDVFDPECAEIIEYYESALKQLVQVQYGVSLVKHVALNKFFNFEKLYDEMLFFIEHFLNKFLSLNINEKTHPKIYEDLKKICQYLDGREHVFCHRDYHVRNLMLKNDKIYWIDFQDARMGPHSYDLVSLLRDSYVDITWQTRAELFKYYFDELNEKRSSLDLPCISLEDLHTESLFMGLQRNLKALGSFGYLAMQKQKYSYLKTVNRAFNTICAKEALQSMSKKDKWSLDILFPDLFELLFSLNSGDLESHLNQNIQTFLKKDEGNL